MEGVEKKQGNFKRMIQTVIRETLKELQHKPTRDRTRSAFDRTKQTLYQLHSLRDHIELCLRDIEDFQREGEKRRSKDVIKMCRGTSGIDLDELAEIRLQEKIKAKHEDIERTSREIDRINWALDKVKGEKGFEVIHWIYVEGMSLKETAKEVHASESSVHRWNVQIINKLSGILYGMEGE
ncbi:MAG: hypothetical protein SFH39_00145 [Candidatus Magnetobacterium sp. LHC-1]